MKHTYLLFTLVSLILSLPAIAQNDLTVPQTQRSLISKRTATWCPNCGRSSAWDLKNRLIENLAEKALVISAHHSQGSQLYSGTAADLIDNFETTFSQPVFYFNSEFVGTGGDQTESAITDKVNSAVEVSPLAQTGLKAIYSESNRTLDIETTTEFFTATEGEFQVGIYLIQKSVIAAQSNVGSEAEHKNVLWEAINGSSFGEPLAQGSIAANSRYDVNTSFELPEEMVVENLIISSIIWKKNENDRFDFINLNTTDEITSSIVSKIPDIEAIKAIEILPNLTRSDATLSIDLQTGLKDLDISLWNPQGQLIQQVYQGNLNSGNHTFLLQPSNPGIHLLRVQNKNGVNTLRLIRI